MHVTEEWTADLGGVAGMIHLADDCLMDEPFLETWHCCPCFATVRHDPIQHRPQWLEASSGVDGHVVHTDASWVRIHPQESARSPLIRERGHLSTACVRTSHGARGAIAPSRGLNHETVVPHVA